MFVFLNHLFLLGILPLPTVGMAPGFAGEAPPPPPEGSCSENPAPLRYLDRFPFFFPRPFPPRHSQRPPRSPDIADKWW